jgi:hypothetical protein
MKVRITVLIICVSLCLLYLAGGCEEEKTSRQKSVQAQQTKEQAPGKPVASPESRVTSIPKTEKPKEAEIKPADANTTQAPVNGPRITFEKTSIDLGIVGTDTNSVGEFKFKSTGTEPVEIKNIRTTCGCATAKLDKTQYQPGESNSIKITFHSGPMNDKANKTIYVITNDPVNHTARLTITATVVKKVEVKPDRLNLSLKKQNADCPDIIIQSTDNQPFAITKINSTADCFSFDFDPSRRLTKHILKPVIDMKKLEQLLTGEIKFTITHPECSSIKVYFSAPPEFSAGPPTLLIIDGEPNVPTTRDQIWVYNNYDEDFEIQSVYSSKGYIKNLKTEKPETAKYILTLEITPPKKEGGTNSFTDTVIIKTNTGREIKIPCRGYYKRPPG